MNNSNNTFGILSLVFAIFLIQSCNNAEKYTQQLLGSWEIIKMETYTAFTANAVKIDFIKGSENKVNLFYLYLTDGSKYEGQWKFYKDGSFEMKFHEGHSGVSDEDQIWTKDKGDYFALTKVLMTEYLSPLTSASYLLERLA